MTGGRLSAARDWLLTPVMFAMAALSLGLAGCATASPPATYATPAPAVLVEAWIGPVEEVRTDRVMTFYRAYGGGANRLGAWMSATRPTSSRAVRAEMALPPQNTAEMVSVVTVPAGVLIKRGTAAPAFDQPGGGAQVQLLELIPPESFSEPAPLPPEAP